MADNSQMPPKAFKKAASLSPAEELIPTAPILTRENPLVFETPHNAAGAVSIMASTYGIYGLLAGQSDAKTYAACVGVAIAGSLISTRQSMHVQMYIENREFQFQDLTFFGKHTKFSPLEIDKMDITITEDGHLRFSQIGRGNATMNKRHFKDDAAIEDFKLMFDTLKTVFQNNPNIKTYAEAAAILKYEMELMNLRDSINASSPPDDSALRNEPAA